MYLFKYFPAFLLASLLIGCATVSEFEKSLQAGAKELTDEEVVNLHRDMTHRDQEGQGFIVYYAADGTKLAKNPKGFVERKWWVDDDGKVCQTLFDANKTVCGVRVLAEGDIYRAYDPNSGQDWGQFIAEQGNTEGLGQ